MSNITSGILLLLHTHIHRAAANQICYLKEKGRRETFTKDIMKLYKDMI